MPKFNIISTLIIFLFLTITPVMAQTENESNEKLVMPAMMTEILTRVAESAKAREALLASSPTTVDYVQTRNNIIQSDMREYADKYSAIDKKEVAVVNPTNEEIIATLQLTIIRYKALQSALYKSRITLNDSLEYLYKSGFDKERIRAELDKVTKTEGEIEDQLEGLILVLERAQNGEISSEEALRAAQEQSTLIKTQYAPVLTELGRIIETSL